jgi:GPI mannosyltransferase 3
MGYGTAGRGGENYGDSVPGAGRSGAARGSGPALVLPLLCALALALRVGAFLLFPNTYYPDEIHQTMEQAHRVVFGTGVVPWEFQAGIRSWLTPGIAVVAFLFAKTFLAGGGAGFRCAQILFSLLSLSPVICGFLWARRLAGARAALVTGLLCAVWFEMVYYAPKGLSEVASGHVLLIGLYLLFPGEDVRSRLRLAFGALLAGLAVAMRIQLAPAGLLVAIMALRRGRAGWWPLLAGFAAAAVAAGTLDYFTLPYPFSSVFGYFEVNMLQKANEAFGVVPWYGFLMRFAWFWSVALIPILWFGWVGSRKLPVLAGVALAVVVPHCMVAHKETRFVYAAVPCVMILTGIGAEAVVSRRWPGSRRALTGLLATCCTVSALLAAMGFRSHWAYDREGLEAFTMLREDASVCGIALVGRPVTQTPGYTVLDRDIPLFEPGTPVRVAAVRDGANVVVSAIPIALEGYRLVRRWDYGRPMAIYRRGGGCDARYRSQRLGLLEPPPGIHLPNARR